MMTLDEMAQYLAKLAVKTDDQDEKINLAVISGVLTVFAEQRTEKWHNN